MRDSSLRSNGRRFPRGALIALAVLLSVIPASAQTQAAYSTVRFHSEEVRKGKISESGDIHLYVLLPPSYAASPARRYPVVYCFHGYGDSGGQLVTNGRRPLTDAWNAGTCPEFIMVGVEGYNSLGGSFYADSPATGNWSGMVTKEVVPYVDATYRTIAKPEARGLAGFSMGGFGAWNIGLASAELFSWVWSACPGAFAPGGLAAAIPTWDDGFMNAYGAAFAPDLRLASPYARTPAYAAGKVADDEVARLWYSGFGDIEGKLARYLAKAARLRGVRFDSSDQDYYAWIPEGTKYIADAMKKAGIDVVINTSWTTGHGVSSNMMEQSFVPFFAGAFKGLDGR
jgi:enterochelin esterase-like enzyme